MGSPLRQRGRPGSSRTLNPEFRRAGYALRGAGLGLALPRGGAWAGPAGLSKTTTHPDCYSLLVESNSESAVSSASETRLTDHLELCSHAGPDLLATDGL